MGMKVEYFGTFLWRLAFVGGIDVDSCYEEIEDVGLFGYVLDVVWKEAGSNDRLQGGRDADSCYEEIEDVGLFDYVLNVVWKEAGSNDRLQGFMIHDPLSFPKIMGLFIFFLMLLQKKLEIVIACRVCVSMV